MFKPELGCLNDFELEIKFKPEARPISHKLRPVPLAIWECLNDDYKDGIRKGVWKGTDFNAMEPPWFGCERQSFQDRTRLGSGSVRITQ